MEDIKAKRMLTERNFVLSNRVSVLILFTLLKF